MIAFPLSQKPLEELWYDFFGKFTTVRNDYSPVPIFEWNTMHFFAKNITYLKNHKNIDIIKIAARLGAAFPYLASGQVQPTVQDLLALSDFFNINIDDLLKKDLARHAELMARVDIKFLVLDVDGTMTDGGMYFNSSGDEIKKFNAKDGRGIINAIKAGVPVALLSSGLNKPLLEKRADILGIKHVFANEADKLTVLNQWCKELNISLKETAFIGDDINDLKVMQQVGIAACPADAIRQVRNTAHIILTEKGGEGCVREFIDTFIGL